MSGKHPGSDEAEAVTAENITDEQIRELLEEYTRIANEAHGKLTNCHVALGVYEWLDKDGNLARDARARCAEILEARRKEGR